MAAKENRIGLPLKSYKGLPSTLCKGCGHDVISNTIAQAFFEMGVDPYRVAKMSGIGCSSKTPAYFLSSSWGFNSVHGRMPSVATGALLANRQLIGLGMSGDGDTASIGIGQFVHMLRRQVPFIYVVANNGVYGLTKGQFSATADEGSRLKDGTTNDLPKIDLCALAIELGATFVARAFSADRKQLLELFKAAIAHEGMAVLDVMSPCVTFNNHEGSTMSYDWGRDHEGPIHEIGFVPSWDHPDIEQPDIEDAEDVASGRRAISVPMPDGSTVNVRRVGVGHDPRDRDAALDLLWRSRDPSEFLTGLFYLDPDESTLFDVLRLVEEPLATLPEDDVRPLRPILDQINRELS